MSNEYSPPKPWPYYLIFCLAGLALFTPLLPASAIGGPVMLKGAAFQFLALLAGAAWLAMAISHRRYWPDLKNPLIIVALVWAAYLVATLPLAIDPELTFWSNRDRMIGVLANLHWLVWLVVLGSTLRSWREWRPLLVITNFVAVLIGAIGLLELTQHPAGFRMESTLGNAIYLSYYILPHFFVSLILLARSRGWFQRSLYAATAVMHLYIVIQTATRGALIPLLLGALVAAIGYLMIFGRNRRRSIGIGLAVIAAVILLGGAVGWARLSGSGQAWGQKALPASVQRLLYHDFGSDRLSLWRMGLEGWLERPILGRGLENYAEAIDSHFDVKKDASLSQNWYDRTHNQFIDTLIGTGAIGFIVYLAFWAAALLVLIRGLIRVSSRQDSLTLWLLVPLVLAHMGAIFFAFETVSGTMVVWVALAMGLGLTRHDRESESDQPGLAAAEVGRRKEKRRKGKKGRDWQEYRSARPGQDLDVSVSLAAVLILLTAASLLGWWIDWRPYGQSAKYNATMANALRAPDTVAKQLEDLFSKRTFVLHDLRYNLLSRLRTYSEGVQAERSALRPLIEFAAGQMDHSLATRSYNFKTLLASAYIKRELATYDRSVLDSARSICQQAIDTAPTRPEGYEEMAEVDLVAGDLDGAWEQLQTALSLSRHAESDGRIHMRRAGLQALRGNLDEAEHEIDLAARGYRIGVDFREVGIFAQAMEAGQKRPQFMRYYQEVVKIRPSHSLALAAYIVAAEKNGDRRLAEEQLTVLAKYDPASAKSLSERLGLNYTPPPGQNSGQTLEVPPSPPAGSASPDDSSAPSGQTDSGGPRRN